MISQGFFVGIYQWYTDCLLLNWFCWDISIRLLPIICLPSDWRVLQTDIHLILTGFKEIQTSLVVLEEPYRVAAICVPLHQSGPYCRVARQKPFLTNVPKMMCYTSEHTFMPSQTQFVSCVVTLHLDFSIGIFQLFQLHATGSLQPIWTFHC